MATEVSEMIDRAREMMSRSLIALEEAQKRALAQLAEPGDYDDKLGSHVAWVTRQVAEVTGALRQLEKHDRLMSRTPEQRYQLVRAYVEHEASPLQRSELLGLLQQLDTGRSVLS